MPSIISTKTSGGGGIAVTGDTSGVLQLASNNGTTAVEIDASQVFKFNSGYGSVATAYGCRAWVNFNGTGTVAIRASGNVTSITDNGTGNYTVNFTTAIVDNNYTTVTTARRTDGGAGAGGDMNVLSAVLGSAALTYNSAVTTSSVRVGTGVAAGTFFDCDCFVSVFR
jgi:hypothetical protein